MREHKGRYQMRLRSALASVVLATATAIAGCSGSNSNPTPPAAGATATPVPTSAPTAVPTATPIPSGNSASGTLHTSTTGPTTLGLGPIGTGFDGTVTVGPASVVTNIADVFSLSQPAGTPTIQDVRRRPANIGGASIAPFAFFSLTATAAVSFASPPAFTVQFPSAASVPPPALSFIAYFDPTQPANGWTTLEGPGQLVTSTTMTWTPPNVPFSLAAGQTYVFVAFSTASSLPTPTPVATPTATPTASPSPTATPSPTPTPAPPGAPGPLALSTPSVSLTAAGATAQFSATESNYTGTLTATDGSPSCAGIATVAPASGNGPSATFTVTAVAHGICTINVSDDHGGSLGEQVTVTTTTGTISSRKRN
jgi:hypothetical protein